MNVDDILGDFVQQRDFGTVYQQQTPNYITNNIAFGNPSAVLSEIRTDNFNDIADNAYANYRGYSIGYHDGAKVMYVSGSRNIVDWILNGVDTVLPSNHHYITLSTAKRLSAIAKREGVDVVVGHSRGAHIVSQMDGNFQKLGLDGATMLSGKKGNIMNISQKGHIDAVIRKRNNPKQYNVRTKRIKHSHFVSRDYAGYKPMTKKQRMMAKYKWRQSRRRRIRSMLPSF